MNNRTYIKNTALLIAAMAVTKIVGAIFKIPLANILGGTGMGYFSTAYSIYSPVFAVTAAGVPTVIMRLTAQNLALGHQQNAKRIKSVALMLFAAVGAAGTLLIWALADHFADNIACSPQSKAAIIAIAPAVLFCCIGAVIRGYYEGMSNVLPTAAANVTEAVSRAVIGLALSSGTVAAAKYCFDNGLPFLGRHYVTYEDAYTAALPWAAAAAIVSVTLSEVCGLVALLLHDKRYRKRSLHQSNEHTQSTKAIIIRIFKDLVPIAAFALVMNCFSFIDLITVTRTLDLSLSKYPDYFARQFMDIFQSGIEAEGLANFMYGSYSGIAISLFMLIPSFAGMSEKTALPEIAAAWERKDDDALYCKTSSLVRMCSLIGCPACMGAAALAEPILTMLYPSRSAEVSVCKGCFIMLAVFGMFMVIASALAGVFQAIGKPHVPLFTMAGAVLLKLLLNPILLSIKEINITGAALSTGICYAVVALISTLIAKKYIKGFKVIRTIRAPLFSATICAVTARSLYKCLKNTTILPVATLISIGLAAFVYVLLLIITGFFRTSLIIKPLNEKNCLKRLAKKSKIG